MTKLDHLEIAVGHLRKASTALNMASADLGTPREIVAGRYFAELFARELADLVEREKIKARHRVDR
jgi:hypothetical protein